MAKKSVGGAKSEGLNRRALFDALSSVTVGLAGTSMIAEQVKAAPAEETKFEELENFKFDIENQKGWQGPAGSAKEATVAELPISQTIAGVSMRLEPGAIRELHWHALAAEWAYVLTGRCRGTVISPNGQAEISDFEVGDTWYFPRGHRHHLQSFGPGDCHFILGFDNGHFSEFGTFSITDWIARTSPKVLARNLGLPESAFAQFPKKEVYIGPGKVPTKSLEDFLNLSREPNRLAHKLRLH